jgi:ABC-type nitrate/sulfonate/bicarbonate transport system substrate-binding protein
MKGIWIKLLGRVVALSFVLSLIAINSVAGQEKLKFPVSASSKTLGYSPLWVAHRQGFFDQQGLDVQLVLVSGADKSTMALMGGSVFASSGDRCNYWRHRAGRGSSFIGRRYQRPDTRAHGGKKIQDL